MIFHLPGRIKPYVRMTQRGKWVKPDAIAYRADQQRIGMLVTNAMALESWEMFPPKTPLAVAVEYSVSDRQHNHDLDNVVKALLDGMNGIVYQDDRWIDKINVTRVLAAWDGAIVVICPMYKTGSVKE